MQINTGAYNRSFKHIESKLNCKSTIMLPSSNFNYEHFKIFLLSIFYFDPILPKYYHSKNKIFKYWNAHIICTILINGYLCIKF